MLQPEPNLLIVEDEPLIALMVEDMASDLGWRSMGSARTEIEALNLLERSTPSLAVLDIKLGSSTSLGIATTCRERNIPIVFITGYTAADVPRECGDAPVLAKPFSPADFARALQRGLSQNSERPLAPQRQSPQAGERALCGEGA